MKSEICANVALNGLPRKVFNVFEIAQILQTSETTVRSYISRGELKAFKIGRTLIAEKALDDFIANQQKIEEVAYEG